MNAISSPNRIRLNEGETLYVEPGAMLAYQNCEMRTGIAAGGVFDKMRRCILGGESLIQNEFRAGRGGGWVALEEYMPGQVVKKSLSQGESPLMIRRSALVASSSNVNLDAKYLGLSGYLRGQGVSMLSASVDKGHGDVFFHTTDGVVRAFQVKALEGPVYVDNKMILAYSENLKTSVSVAGQNANSWLFSGEGVVTKFEGDGTIYVGGTENQYKPQGERTQ